MSKTIPERDWGLTRQQELLMQAAFLHEQAALAAWQAWRSRYDLEVVEPGTYRLLPQIFRNLSLQAIDDPLLGRLKGIYRRTWYGNQTLLHRIADVLRALHSQEIETMVLGGAALVLRHCKDPGLRPLDSVEVLVETEKAPAAMRLLKELGWRTKLAAPEPFVSVANSMRFTYAAEFSLDLRWRFLPGGRQGDVTPTIWETGVRCLVDAVPTYAPSATYEIAGTCAGGNEWSAVPASITLADAMVIIDSSPRDVDWSLLVALGHRHRLTLTLRDTLAYLSTVLHAPVPAAVLRELEDTPTAGAERLEHWARANRQKLPARLVVLWLSYLRSTSHCETRRRLAGFPGFLQYVWGADSISQLPIRVLRSGGEKPSTSAKDRFVRGKSEP